MKIGFRGTATSDGGLVVTGEPDERLELTGMAGEYLKDKRRGKNIRYEMEGLLRQSLYSRPGGYEDTNDAGRNKGLVIEDDTVEIDKDGRLIL